jgi:hypothetical protein
LWKPEVVNGSWWGVSGVERVNAAEAADGREEGGLVVRRLPFIHISALIS